MIGTLPQTLKVCDQSYKIRSDYRSVLRIISAYNDDRLSENEKVYVCLRRMYEEVEKIPRTAEAYAEALKAANEFIECKLSDDRPSPQVVNWEKDEQMIFPAINKVAGMEVRSVPYMHWWTFLGYFMGIDRDDLFGMVLTIRQKKATGKDLEKHEKEFYNANQDLCSIGYHGGQKSPEDSLNEIYEALLKEGGE